MCYITNAPFYGVIESNCILYVPKGRVSYFNSECEWEDFKSIQEDPTSNILNSTLNEINIITQNNGQTTISNLPTGEILSVYSVQGCIIHSQMITDANISFTLPLKGVYILNIGNASRKFVY